MTAAATKRMTVADFLVWDDGTEQCYELYSGSPIAMGLAPGFHQIVLGNVLRQIGNAAERRPSYVARFRAGISPPGRLDSYYQADVVVARGPRACSNITCVEDPLLIVEVLSPTTEDRDRKIKLPDYRGIASVREILFVDSQRRYVEIHRRQDGGRWLVDLLRDPDARVVLDCIGLDVPLDAIYANMNFDQPDPAAASNA